MILRRALPHALTVAAALACAAIGCTSAPEPVLTCENPVPVEGTYNPSYPGYNVGFHDHVDTPAEAARLADRYGFQITELGSGFFAFFDDEVRDQLRCEPSVRRLGHAAPFES